MTAILMLVGAFFLVGWLVAIAYAIRMDLRDSRERKSQRMRQA